MPVVEETTRFVESTTVTMLKTALEADVMVTGISESMNNSLSTVSQTKRPALPGSGRTETFSILKLATGKLLKSTTELIRREDEVIAPMANLVDVTDPSANNDVPIDPSNICSFALICLKFNEGICYFP